MAKTKTNDTKGVNNYLSQLPVKNCFVACMPNKKIRSQSTRIVEMQNAWLSLPRLDWRVCSFLKPLRFLPLRFQNDMFF
jgi:hypothetical protein